MGRAEQPPTLVASFPANQQDLTFAKRNGTIEQNVFYGLSGAEVEAKLAKLKADGYRPTSLNIHGSTSDAKYAGIWTKQTGEDFETILGANKTVYDAWLDSHKSQGFVSTHVSATGSSSDALFAGVMEKVPSVANWIQVCGLDNPYGYANATVDEPMYIKGVSMYGAPNERQYCILGHEDLVNYQQTVFYQTDYFKQDYAKLLQSETSKRHWRPVFIDLSEDLLPTPIFDDTSVGQWVARTDLSASELEAEIAAQKAKNLYAVHIAGAGSKGSKYAVLFAEQLSPLERKWTVTGEVTGFKTNDVVAKDMDAVMEEFMKKNSVRQAQVAASVNGTVVAERSYTWAESDRAVVKPTDKFGLGSVSKMFTYAATTNLLNEGLLNHTTRVYPFLGMNNPADNRSLDITVDHLLQHTAGFNRNIKPDIGFIFRNIALERNQTAPVSLRELIEYVYEQPLDFTPGTDSVYSNYGTMLLSYLIANITGESFDSYIHKNVLNGLDVELYPTSPELNANNPIVQETKYTFYPAQDPASTKQVSNANGGDGSIREEAIGAFGLRASASTISQFLANHAAYDIGPRQAYTYRDGTIVGSRAFAQSQDLIDWSLILNTREYENEQKWEQLVFGPISKWYKYALAE
ncbi:hypothetical protein E8E13_004131 [Curvularia kusanoi]|uniref:Beta-lactamase-related domain-containing protein n=1 Tax=Curvularia kusanoi TaxID=90978 RepID=A0A9P4TDI9_CURKU|nr:hypothetical protein E8E13_004131 [Curvularia kusanoi]